MNRWAAVAVLLTALTLEARAAPPVPAVSFEQDVRPILNRCVVCHGAGKARGGLRLDSKEAATAAADSGYRAIVPGKPDESELLRRVRSTAKDTRMPPRGELLTAAQIEKLRNWIAADAPWPAHWAYRPLARPPVPQLPVEAPPAWARTPVDLFVLQRQAALGLAPAPEADRRILLRRVSLDLIGLPPTPEEVESFLADRAPDAYEKVVERLLASPHHGERWARHWMDVVHFAETHGHDQDRPREHAWPYRDYLIRAFNRDEPYARFVQQQVAGDVLFPGDPGAVAATGFLAAGPWDESSLRDIREDSLDREVGRNLDRDDIVTTVMATFVSTTVHCARCHDHKFDPVTQDEYYSLQAVFAGTDKANRSYDPDPLAAGRRRQLAERLARLAKRDAELERSLHEPALQAEVAAWERTIAGAAKTWQVLTPTELKSSGGATLTQLPDGSVLSAGKRPEKDTTTVAGSTNLQGITALRLEVLTDDSLPKKGPGRQDNGNLHLNEATVTAAGQKVAIRSAQADFDQQGWTAAHAIDGNPGTAWGIYPEVSKPHSLVLTFAQPLRHEKDIPLSVRLEQTHGGGHLIGRFRLSVTTHPQPATVASLPAEVAELLKIEPAKRTERQRADLGLHYFRQKLEAELKTLPPRGLVYCGTSNFEADGSFRPAREPRPVRVLKRGDVKTPGAVATPGALACVPGLDPRFKLDDPLNEGARRAALARWLSDPRNGLTWRSIANRVWQYHFGRGLVDTPSDFGRMGSPPTHPELLDWLACELRDNDGSLKRLHRLIVTSSVYRQSARHHPGHAARDGDNRGLWRMNRRRLDAESVRDAALLLSGKLDRRMGGPSDRQFIQKPGVHVTPVVDYLNFNVDDPANHRRSVYRFLFRTLPDPFMESLDCPDGSQLSPVRTESVTALQALSMLNDKLLVRLSEHIARRVAGSSTDARQQVTMLFRLLLCREPTVREADAISTYTAKHGLANACRVLLNSNEFVFVD